MTGDDDEVFQVTVTYTVEAKDRKAAAMKAYALGAEMPPYEFSVKDAAGMAKDVTLSHEERDAAMGHNIAGDMFGSEL